MWTIASGIILALVVLELLPALLGASVVLVSLAILLGLALTVGYFFFTNPAGSLIFCLLLISFAFICVVSFVYAKSKNARLFFRELVLRLMIPISPRKRAEKELALEELGKEIEAHCSARNAAIRKVALDDILTVSSGVWNKFRQYGELTNFSAEGQIRFASTEIGELFSVEISVNFPKEDRPTLRMQAEGRQLEVGTSAHDLKAAMKATVKRRLLEFERKRVRQEKSGDTSK
jgi:hypothetical protein